MHESRFALPLAMLLLAGQTAAASAQARPPELTLPEITVSPDGANREKEKRALQQLNKELRRKVDETNPSLNLPPIDARSQDLKTGIVNIPAVQQQYGRNFGRSVIPYRPSAPTYTAPIGRR